MKKLLSIYYIKIITLLVVFLLTILCLYTLTNYNSKPTSKQVLSKAKTTLTEPSLTVKSIKKLISNNLPDHTKKYKLPTPKNLQETRFGFDISYIFDALQAINIDANNSILIDHTTKNLLESAFLHVPYDLSDVEISELEELIRLALPGTPGKQASDIVINYYHYRIAESDFLSSSYVNSPKDALQQLHQLESIRNTQLGYETAKKLYGLDHEKNKFTIQSMIIQSNNDLSIQEKNEKQNNLIALFNKEKEKYFNKNVKPKT